MSTSEISKDFRPVPLHERFYGKMLFQDIGNIVNVQLAEILPAGGGPVDPEHRHEHDHLFIVLDGECLVREGNKEYTLHKNECARVRGNVPHSTWNTGDGVLRMLGICIKA